MSKEKFNSAQASEILENLLSDNIKNTLIESNLIPDSNFITSKTYIDKGVRVRENYCPKCNSTFIADVKTIWSPYRHVIDCPTCGNRSPSIGSGSVHLNKQFLYAIPTDDGLKGVIYDVVYKYESNTTFKEIPSKNAKIEVAVLLKSDYGLYVMDSDKKMYRRGTIEYTKVFELLKSIKPANKFNGDFDAIIDEMVDFETARESKKASKKSVSKTALLEAMRLNYKAKPINKEMLTQKYSAVFNVLYSTKDDHKTWLTCCSKCGCVREVDSLENITCPVCGNKNSDNVRVSDSFTTLEADVVSFENTNLPDNDLLVRVFKVRVHYDINKGIEDSVLETQRIFLGKKIYVYDNVVRMSSASTGPDDFKKSTIRNISYTLCSHYSHREADVLQSNDELKMIIQNSCLAYSGLLESYGLGRKEYQGYKKAPNLTYIVSWYKHPGVELILKSNLTNLLEDVVRFDNIELFEGKNLAEILGIAPHVIKIVTKINPRYDEIATINHLYQADNSLTHDKYIEIKNSQVSSANLVWLKRNLDIDYSRSLLYLQTVYDNQCIHKNEALTLWVDYLRMAQLLKIDLKDKNRKYPGSLKKEHDVATFAYKAVQIELDKEKFAAQAKENSMYEYSYKDLVVVVPKTPQDIVEEATRQKNCLRSYVERVKNGETVVVFIRRKIMPDATYVTAEVHNGRLVQLKGYCNSNPRNKELVEFVQHWAKAKSIVVEC